MNTLSIDVQCSDKKLEKLAKIHNLLGSIGPLGRQYVLDYFFSRDEIYEANQHNCTPATRSADGYDREFHDNYGGEYIEIGNPTEMEFDGTMQAIDKLLDRYSTKASK